MRIRLIAFLSLLLPLLWTDSVEAQVPRDFAVDLTATTSYSPPCITLNWTQRRQANITSQRIYRRLKGEVTWTLQATLTTTDTTYADNTAAAGLQYDYWMQRNFTGISPTTAMGYVSAGAGVPMTEGRGKLLLVIDNTMFTPLAPEISQLQQDLATDGWTVVTISANRSGTAVATKALIKAAYDADPTQVKMVYLLGHVPVPYSGNIAPDGHPDHVGAWPADGYYGDMDGTWTDTSINSTSGSSTRNHNTPGDGKFDQSTLPSALELAVGRVDLHTMQKAPNTSVSEASLLRRYLKKAHDYRFKQGAYQSITPRALIRDGFGYFSGENFATSGWAWAFSTVGAPPLGIIDEAPSDQFFNYAANNSYLVGYGCGGGSYESASSVGTTTQFGLLPYKAVFTSLFGSYHGDWDIGNNFMRAAIAGNATGDSLGLSCFWAGRPHYFMFQTGMGGPIGSSIQQSQNGGLSTVSNPVLTPAGSSSRGVHTGLMGDPSLRMQMVKPTRKLAATSANGTVALTWAVTAETALVGYHVYRLNPGGTSYVRLTTTPLSSPSYTDATAVAGQNYTYLVRTLKIETVPGGTFENLSHGTPVSITASGSGTSVPANPTSLTLVSQSSSVNAQLTWDDNASDETNFIVERRTGNGSWSTVATLPPNTTSHTDTGTFVAGSVYSFRVYAANATGSSALSNEVSVEPVAGFIQLTDGTHVVAKTDGSVTFTVERIGGTTGEVKVAYATIDSSAISGTHYTTRNGALTWPDGDSAPKTVSVPILNSATQRLPRQFKLNISSPTNGASLLTTTSAACLILDSTATLPSPWVSAQLGTVTYAAPAVEAEGAIGSNIVGGSGVTSAATAEAGRFIYQPYSGDAALTVYLPVVSPAQTTARYAIMAREGTGTGAIMAASVASTDTGGTGAKFAYRTTTSGAAIVSPVATNGLGLPRWLRLIRLGTSFISETSDDGTTWTNLGTSTVPLSSSANWGLFHYSADVNTTTGLLDYQLAQFQNVTLGAPPSATAPAGLAGTYTGAPGVDLSWSASTYATGYRIERRIEGGVFAEIGTVAAGTLSFQNGSLAADTAYEYRVLAYNSTGSSPSSETVKITTPMTGRQTKPSFLTATPAPVIIRISAEWQDNSTSETGYELERRASGGTFSLLQNLNADTVWHPDNTVLPGVIYQYRVRAKGSPADSSWSGIATATAPGTATAYQQWLNTYGLPMDASGTGSSSATPLSDGTSNLMKYALGLSAQARGTGSRLSRGVGEYEGTNYLTLTYIRPEPAPAGVTYSVESNGSMDPLQWSSTGNVEVSSSTAGGLRTITVRDSVPAGGDGRRFMRLKVSGGF